LTSPLDCSDGRIVVDSDDQSVGFEFSSLQISYVAHVEKIETAIGECHRLFVAPKCGD
jgi:hypothetical protein